MLVKLSTLAAAILLLVSATKANDAGLQNSSLKRPPTNNFNCIRPGPQVQDPSRGACCLNIVRRQGKECKPLNLSVYPLPNSQRPRKDRTPIQRARSTEWRDAVTR
ncbi:hypothetical protein CCM_01574 [Cordyceps militaris CM01]|uniref:Uncharacterized protein n=1 Tax=Cordyceps militaris (strain CM01) TaxID=983644 RepID=G3J5W4_CORMM|nr:uncharacterized protein CCM_01574 [Cordyceps militaris CM01]EGX96916.1 hypothetical protein CCM_01574 [Cordyceps militaris CM01]